MTSRPLRIRLRRCTPFGVSVLVFCSSAAAQNEVAETTYPSGPTDPAELEAFVDGVMRVHLEEFNTAGAVVSVVKDGGVFFAKGYGYADHEGKRPVDPATTLFRIGSVSKLFVWTSVMQLVEQGRLDLDADVNEYLRDFEIPDTYPNPVTLNHIMAHSAGFEDWVIGLFADDTAAIRPLGEILADQLPARVRPPGEVSSYSNHATGMAAYIVEVVSGVRWQDFIQERILDPLGMRYASFDQPLPDELQPFMSAGYTHDGGKFHKEEFELVPLAPVGAGAVSGTDMARFMIAHLQLGSYGNASILNETTAREMQSDSYRMAPGVNPMSHGFINMSRNGQRIIGHGGDTFWFHSDLALFPDHNLGVFVSYNSQDGAEGTGKFFDAFVDRYFPMEEGSPQAPEDFADRAALFTGHYRSNRFSHGTLAKLAAAVGTVEVTTTDDGTLRLLDSEWAEVAPLTFRELDGDETVVFRESQGGTMSHFFIVDVPIVAFERVPAAERPGLHLFVLLFAVAMMVGTVFSWPFGLVLRRWYKVDPATLVRIPAVHRWVLVAAALLFLVFVLGMAMVLSDPNQIAIAVPRSMVVLLAFPIIAGVLTIAAAYGATTLWLRKQGSLFGRVAYSATVISFLLFVVQLHVWNLLGWRY